MSGERRIEMLWRCSSCGHKNLGRHLACQGCGSPKDDSEEYEMPADTSAAPSVTDPELLRLARAGANWRCRYCGSDQRTSRGLARNVARRKPRDARPRTSPPRQAVVPAQPLTTRRSPLLLVPLVALVLLALGVCASLSARGSRGARERLAHATPALALPFHEETASVTGLAWRQVISVDRYQILEGEGFEESKPAEAFAVRPTGPRFHHNERVLAGYDTESYPETVPDGFRSETYSEQEACGQDCTPRPETCREKCTPDKNGFATCRNECTGGGQDCRTKYCSVTKTRQVPQTKTVTKTRQVPRYKDEPRSATWYSWKFWDWRLARTLEKSGTGAQTVWPSADEVALDKRLGKGERERARRFGEYRVYFQNGNQARTLVFGRAEELARYPVGSSQRLRIWSSGRIEAL